MAAWPRSAQVAAAFLLGVALTLLALRCYEASSWAARPTEPVLVYRIDLNRADRAELLQLPGVGDRLAGRIENYRQQHGGFRDVDDLVKVHGVGPATVERLRPWVAVRPDDTGKEHERRLLPNPKTKGKKEAGLTEPINVNRATAEELQRLPGIGPTMAQRILDARAKKPFSSVDDLRRVSGIGPKTLEKLRSYVSVSAPANGDRQTAGLGNDSADGMK